MPTTDIVRVREDQIDIAAGVLARAFQLDPVMVYVVPDADERARLLPPFMKAFVTYATMFGEPLTTAERPEAVALWLPLDDLSETPERDHQAGIDQIPTIFGAEAFTRFMHIARTAERFHQRTAPEQHLYLQFLGVEPSPSRARPRQRAYPSDAGSGRCLWSAVLPRDVPAAKRSALPKARIQNHDRGSRAEQRCARLGLPTRTA
jgi:hypothetical protein